MCEFEHEKGEICAIGRRIYQRGYAAANEGNISHRVGENQVLCTPTGQCKGSLQPEDICLVDLHGEQLAGSKQCSSEIKLHLEILRARPDVNSVVHTHAPHATAFAIAREPLPQGVLPEAEYFLGNVAFSPYEMTGTKRFAESILPFVEHTNVIVLASHGVVTYDASLERACWLTEVLDGYCRLLILARQLGHVEYLSQENCRELLELKQQHGIADVRSTAPYADQDPRSHAVFRETWSKSGVAQRAFPPAGAKPATLAQLDPADLESLVEKITRRVLAELVAEEKFD
jgi:L-fuculose-phosphate aldolase